MAVGNIFSLEEGVAALDWQLEIRAKVGRDAGRQAFDVNPPLMRTRFEADDGISNAGPTA